MATAANRTPAPPPESFGADTRREAREDYALRRVPAHFRKSPLSIAMVLSGAVWSVFSFALGGSLGLLYGIPTALIGLGCAYVLGTVLVVVITRLTAANGLDIDLLSRGLGYGFLGSAFSSLVYAVTFMMYCGFEASFMATAVNAEWPGVPLVPLYIAAAAVMIPVNWYGFKLNNILQRITWPLFIIGLVALAVDIFTRHHVAGSIWAGPVTAASLLGAIGLCLPVLGIQALAVGDWSRFARAADVGKVKVIASSVSIGGLFLIEAPLGAFLAVYTKQGNPGVYAASTLGVWGVLWVLVTQLRIQNMNYYSASLATANFVARIFRWAPGRQLWIGLTAVVTAVAAITGILNHLTDVLTFFGVVLLAWAGTLLGGMVFGPRYLGISLARVEYRRGYLRNWGPAALSGLAAGSVVGGYLTIGDIPDADYGPFTGQVVALVLAFAVFGAVAAAGKGPATLFARPARPDWEDAPDALVEAGEKVATCAACGGTFIRTDMLPCPHDDQVALCSVCASRDRACHDECRPLLYPGRAPGRRPESRADSGTPASTS
jgi:purine-cytosine permease-like protein